MNHTFEIRLIEPADALAALEVYTPFVKNTAITFEYDAPGVEEFTERINQTTLRYPWLVLTENGRIRGYAYGSRHRYKTAYQWSAESTIYLSSDVQGKGLGKLLYKTLFDLLRIQGFVNVYAGVAQPNAASEQLHRSCGFEEIGVFSKIGFKLGQWHDVRWFQLFLNTAHPTQLEEPMPTARAKQLNTYQQVLQQANDLLKQLH